MSSTTQLPIDRINNRQLRKLKNIWTRSFMGDGSSSWAGISAQMLLTKKEHLSRRLKAHFKSLYTDVLVDILQSYKLFLIVLSIDVRGLYIQQQISQILNCYNLYSYSMGPRNSKQNFVTFMRDYDIIQQNAVENITFLQHKITQDEYLLKQFNFNDKRQCQKTMEKLSQLKNKLSGNKHVVPLKDYLMNTQDQYCSTFYKIYALFEYPQRTLDDQINQRKLHKKRFNQTQLWSILASCIVGLSHLQKNGIKHSALKSNHILLSKEGVIKVSDPFALGQHSNYQDALTKRQSKHAYLSPEQSQSLQQQVIAPNLNPYKSDIWTLGVIMLQAGLLQYQDEQCYRDDKLRVHWETVKYNIKRVGELYSQQFKNMIDYMLSPDQKARPDWLELEDHVMKGQNEGRRSMIQDQQKQLRALNSENYTRNTGGKNTTLTSSNKVGGSQISFQNTYTANPNPNVINTVNNTNVNPMPTNLPVINLNNNINRQSQPYQQKLPIVYQQPIVSSNPINNNYGTYHTLGTGFHFQGQSPRSSNSPSSYLYSFSGQPNQIPSQLFPQSSPTIINNLNQTNSRISNGTVTNNLNGTNQSTPMISTISGPASNYNITPLKPSIIDQTRPSINIFPNSSYINKTKIDENIIIVTEDELQIQSNIPNGEKKKDQQFNSTPIRQGTNQVHFVQQNIPNTNTNGQPNRYSTYSTPDQRQLINVQGKQMRPITVITNDRQFYQQAPMQQQVQHQYQAEFVTQQFKLGSRYEGYKLNGLRHGYGKFYYQDGGMYDGNWKENKMEGFGKLYYQSGKLAYQGQWKNDQFVGRGVLYNQSPEPLQQSFDYHNFDQVDEYWSKYQGQFLDDMKHGRGVLYFSNGQKFEGLFKGDIVSGPGIFYCLNGAQVQGNWVQNKKMN